jgi:guanidinoacetate N-methyltransferase
MRDFDVSLQIKNDDFIAPPRDTQRNWLLNRALAEFSSDLVSLDRVARAFVPGSPMAQLQERSQTTLAEQDIMEDWQFPIMKAMAEIVAEGRGDVLEIGFGRGVSARYIQELGVRSHTVVECNDSIVVDFQRWKASLGERDIRLVHARWQDAVDQLGKYDAVFFHTYPLNEEELVENVVNSTTFAEHFFPTASAVLRDGGVFTYMTNEIDSLSREHQRLVLQHFRSFTLRVIEGLGLPTDVRDAWWADSMAVIRAEK